MNLFTICFGKKRNDNKNPNNNGAIAIRSRVFTDSITRGYTPSITKTSDPEIPGSKNAENAKKPAKTSIK